ERHRKRHLRAKRSLRRGERDDLRPDRSPSALYSGGGAGVVVARWRRRRRTGAARNRRGAAAASAPRRSVLRLRDVVRSRERDAGGSDPAVAWRARARLRDRPEGGWGGRHKGI